MVRLQFTIELDYKVSEPSTFVLQILAARTQRQIVIEEHLTTDPPIPLVEFVDPMYGNRGCRLVAAAGTLNVRYRAVVDVDHYFADPKGIEEMRAEQLPPSVLPYLRASRYCQSDRLLSGAYREFGQLPRGFSRVDEIREWVHDRTKFLVGSSHVSTSALDTLVEQCGVCRDFVHLMIAYCRALSIPARFVTGLDYGSDRALGPPDFHSYVEVFLGGRWYLFDPTGISPLTGLLRIATGRDAADVAFATMFGRVEGAMPRIVVDVVVDPQRGLGPAVETDRAVSTADDEPSG